MSLSSDCSQKEPNFSLGLVLRGQNRGEMIPNYAAAPQFLLQLMNLASFSTRFSFSSIYQWDLCEAFVSHLALCWLLLRPEWEKLGLLSSKVKFRESTFLLLPHVKVVLWASGPSCLL